MNKSQSSGDSRKRYAVVGLGGRARMFVNAVSETYKDKAVLVGFCDTNPQRMKYYLEKLQGNGEFADIPCYQAEDFHAMLRETKPHTVIVTTIDRTHHRYIIEAMEAGCDVITEKPLTVDVEKCEAILEVAQRTGRDLRVAFNYRYVPRRTKVKELILAGEIGQVTSVHFEWLLDTRHGADYFRRWHRDKRNSGGLMVHKSTHHFDLVNWWLGSAPELVFGLGRLAFYGRANAEERGEARNYYRATGSPAAQDDPFALHLDNGKELQKLYLEAEKEDGYLRDQNVFGDGISIEDTMSVMVRYKNKAQLTYSLTAYSPYEGCRVAITGTKGRIELKELEKSYVNAGGGSELEGATEKSGLFLYKHWENPEKIDVPFIQGGHGGGDPRMLERIFGDSGEDDPFGLAAGPRDGALSILTGIAANRSFETGQPVLIDDLIKI